VVFKSYDKSSGVTLRSSKVKGGSNSWTMLLDKKRRPYFVCVYMLDEDANDFRPQEGQDYRTTSGRARRA